MIRRKTGIYRECFTAHDVLNERNSSRRNLISCDCDSRRRQQQKRGQSIAWNCFRDRRNEGGNKRF